MSLSSHEIYLILRARNEAGGAISALAKILNGNQKTLIELEKEKLAAAVDARKAITETGKVQAAASDAAIKAKRNEITAIRDSITEIRDSKAETREWARDAKSDIDSVIGKRRDDIKAIGSQIDAIKDHSSEIRRAADIDRDAIAEQIDNKKKYISSEGDLISEIKERQRVSGLASKAEIDGIGSVISAKEDDIKQYSRWRDEISQTMERTTQSYKRQVIETKELTGLTDRETKTKLGILKNAYDKRMLQLSSELTSAREVITAEGQHVDQLKIKKRELENVASAAKTASDQEIEAVRKNVEATKKEVTSLEDKKKAIGDVLKADINANDDRIKSLQGTIDAHKSEIDTLSKKRKEISDISADAIAADDKQIRSLQGKIREHEAEIRKLDDVKKAQSDATKNALDSNAKEIDSINKTIDAQNAKINKLQAIGEAYIIAGTMALAAGGIMIAGYVNAGQAAIEYRQAAALTFTQVDKDAEGHALVTQEHIIGMAKRVATEFPVKFGEIQPALYDIFSSMDIASAEVADRMIDNIAKAAVAGSVELATAGQGIIEVINAWGMEMGDAASAQETLNRVNDVAFTLVKEGVGSYQQFSESIGRSIPSAVKAGATYEDMAGGLAFLTRMGMSNAMASTSLARAYDLISNPKFEEKMKTYGLTTRDASGNFLQMTDIVDQLKGHMEGMSEGEAADFLKDVTEGAGGTIQAMRFMNHAVHDSAGLYGQLTDAMYDSAGAADNAYEIMSQTPEAKIQELANQFDIFKISVGDVATVAIVPIVEALTRMFDWFNNLNPAVQQTIFIIGAVVAVLLVLGGAILFIGGMFAMLAAAGTMVAGGLSAIFLPVTIVIAAIAALIAIIIAVVYWWPQISEAAIMVWDAIVAWWTGLPEWFAGLWAMVTEAVVQWANDAMTAAQTFWNDLVNWFTNLPQMAAEGFEALKTAVVDAFNALIATITGFFSNANSEFEKSGEWYAIITGTFNIIKTFIDTTLETIKTLVAGFFLIIYGIFTGDGQLIQDAWNAMGSKLQEIWSGAWAKIQALLENVVTALKSKVDSWIKGMIDAWERFKSDTKAKFDAVGRDIQTGIDNIGRFFSELPGKVVTAVARLATDLFNQGQQWLDSLGRAVSTGISNAVRFFTELPGKILNAVSGIPGKMMSAGGDIMNGLVRGIMGGASRVVSSIQNALSGAVSSAKKFLGIASPSKLFAEMGGFTAEGLAQGILAGKDTVRKAAVVMVNEAVQPVPDYGVQPYMYNPYYMQDISSSNGNITNIEVNQEINTEEIDPLKQATDLAYEIGARLG